MGGFNEESHLFDMAMALNPGCRALGYIDVLSPTPDLAKAVKGKVWAQLASRVGEVIAAERAAAAAAAANTNAVANRGRAQKKRPRFTLQQSAEAAAQLADMQQSGLYDDVIGSSGGSGEETEDEKGQQSVSAEAYVLIDEWRHKKVNGHVCGVFVSVGKSFLCVCVFVSVMCLCLCASASLWVSARPRACVSVCQWVYLCVNDPLSLLVPPVTTRYLHRPLPPYPPPP